MIRKINHNNMGRSDLGWLNSHFHFSFAEYYNPGNMNFGVMRVLNDDLIAPHTGFDTHPHHDMEIISYIVDGTLTHADSMRNEHELTRGEVQYMSAGTGVYHSEHNKGDTTTRILQIWILPDRQGHTPNYGELRFDWDARKGKWLHMVSSKAGTAPVKINQDANFYSLFLAEGKQASFDVAEDRQAYLVQIEGESIINDIYFHERDALESIGESLSLTAAKDSHYLVIEMAI